MAGVLIVGDIVALPDAAPAGSNRLLVCRLEARSRICETIVCPSMPSAEPETKTGHILAVILEGMRRAKTRHLAIFRWIAKR